MNKTHLQPSKAGFNFSVSDRNIRSQNITGQDESKYHEHKHHDPQECNHNDLLRAFDDPIPIQQSLQP